MWEIPEKLFSTQDNRIVDVEHATDAEFQAWIASHGIPVQDNGIAAWSFEDRAGVILHAIAQGVQLRFSEDIPNSFSSESEVFSTSEAASEAS